MATILNEVAIVIYIAGDAGNDCPLPLYFFRIGYSFASSGPPPKGYWFFCTSSKRMPFS